MKSALYILTATVALSANAMASDLCRASALTAAEDFYGNAPHSSSVRAISVGTSYHVSVGRGNEEDGEHHYVVTFPQGCGSQPTVVEISN